MNAEMKQTLLRVAEHIREARHRRDRTEIVRGRVTDLPACRERIRSVEERAKASGEQTAKVMEVCGMLRTAAREAGMMLVCEVAGDRRERAVYTARRDGALRVAIRLLEAL